MLQNKIYTCTQLNTLLDDYTTYPEFQLEESSNNHVGFYTVSSLTGVLL